HGLREQAGRDVQVDTARTAGQRGTDSANHGNADVFRTVDKEGCLTERTCDVQLVHFFVVTLLQVDDFTLGRTGDQNHREAVGGGVGQSGNAVQEGRSGYGYANARLLGQIAGDRSCVACVLFVA